MAHTTSIDNQLRLNIGYNYKYIANVYLLANGIVKLVTYDRVCRREDIFSLRTLDGYNDFLCFIQPFLTKEEVDNNVELDLQDIIGRSY